MESSWDLEMEALLRRAGDGLERLAQCWEDDGAPEMAAWWLEMKRRSELTSTPVLDLLVQIAQGLGDLAQRCEEKGYLEQAAGWRAYARLILDRAWERERTAIPRSDH
jgi:hypothetical protein